MIWFVLVHGAVPDVKVKTDKDNNSCTILPSRQPVK